MKQLILSLLIIAAAPALRGAAAANVPPELLQWQDWVLRTHPQAQCPFIAGADHGRRCAWPGTLELDINDAGAEFVQHWTLYGRGQIPLPGDKLHWPAQVENNGRAAAVIQVNDRPVIQLEPGQYRITGKFTWQERPQFLQVPVETGLLQLHLNGASVPWPNRDGAGRLWFKAPAAELAGGAQGDSVQVQVFRRIRDGIPITVDTVLRLVVSGKPRELLLGRLLPGDSEPERFNSALPARIENDGMLRIQVRPGNWSLNLSSRFRGNITQLSMDRRSDDWPQQEIWSFMADPLLRGVKLSGPAAVDPSQLDVPPGWSKLPTYLMNPGTSLKFEQQYRGDVAPAANQIRETRTLWLDLDGAGATVTDHLSGTMYQGWRLAVQPDIALGRVTIDGEPELVTRLGQDRGRGDTRQPAQRRGGVAPEWLS